MPTPSSRVFEAALRDKIWQVGIEARFASGKPANNKIDWEGLFLFGENPENPQDPQNFKMTKAGEMVVKLMAGMIESSRPDLLVGVPTGGQRFAMAIGREVSVDVARLKKVRNEPGLKTYTYETPDDKAMVEESGRLNLVEDATSEFTSLIGAVRLLKEADGERAIAVTAIHRRDDGTNERPLDALIDWLIPDAPIPNLLTPDHPTFQRFGHLAVGELSQRGA